MVPMYLLKNLGMPGGGAADTHKENAQMRGNDHKMIYIIRASNVRYLYATAHNRVPRSIHGKVLDHNMWQKCAQE